MTMKSRDVNLLQPHLAFNSSSFRLCCYPDPFAWKGAGRFSGHYVPNPSSPEQFIRSLPQHLPTTCQPYLYGYLLSQNPYTMEMQARIPPTTSMKRAPDQLCNAPDQKT